jgi:purine-cytosine permease-like protein
MPIESKSIDYVHEHERHGRVIDQGPFWFLGNFHFFTIAIGFVGPSMGLGFAATSVAGALGILFGTLFVAFHASQGAELGLPQMIQSRAQFGFRGVTLVLIGTLFTFLGFNVADTVLTAQGLHGILGWNESATTLGAAVIATVLAVYGHDWLHRTFRWCFYLSMPLYTFLTLAIMLGKVPAGHVAAGHFTWVAFIAQFAASASYNITYAPSVSDYSRYLPRDTAPGAIIAAVMGLNAYSGMLTVVTAVSSLGGLQHLPAALRHASILALAAVWVAVSLIINSSAIALLFAVLTIMLYLLVPWTSVNLVDYFFVRHGRYAVTHLFMPEGIYGEWAPED